MIRVMKPHASGHKNTCKGRGMNLLLPIEQLAKHIMSASALSLKLQALSALWAGGCWNPVENVLVRRGILLPETVIFAVLNPIKINGMSAPLSSSILWPQRVIELVCNLKRKGQSSLSRSTP